MRQSPLFRLLGHILVPLYAMGAWIAPTLQVCPMHGSPPAAHASMQMASAHNAHSQHATASESAAVQSDVGVQESAASSDTDDSSHKHGCDCLGCCASTNGPAVPATELALIEPAEHLATPIEMQNAEVAITRFAHVLPFATAPPNTLV